MKNDDLIPNRQSRNISSVGSDPNQNQLSRAAKRNQQKKLAEKRQRRKVIANYLAVSVLFIVTVAVIAGICLITSRKAPEADVNDVYEKYRNTINQNLYQNTGENDIISPIDSMSEGEISFENQEAYEISYDASPAGPEHDTDTEPIYQSEQLKKTAAPRVSSGSNSVPVAETTAEPVDLYVSRINTDILFEAASAQEIKSEPETTAPESIDSQNFVSDDPTETEIQTTPAAPVQSLIPESVTPTDIEQEISEPDSLIEPQAEDTLEKVPEPEPEYSVTLKYIQSENIKCSTVSMTVGELLNNLNITLTKKDKQYIDVDQMIYEDCVIQMETLETKTDSVEESIPYETVYINSQTVPKGTENVLIKGSNGVRVKEYTKKYINGTLISETFSKEYIKKYPVNASIEKGVGGTLTGADGITYSYSYYIDVKATTYTGGGTTATGLPADEKVIAVDPTVIPLKSRVYVKGDYGDFGVRIAADVGGGIKNNIIDVYLESANPYFADFGWRNMRAYILED